jgi:uncharacterized membrane protein
VSDAVTDGWTRAASLTDAMVEAARAGDWDCVEALEGTRAALLADPALRVAIEQCPTASRAALRDRIEEMLGHDVEVTTLARAARDEAGAELASHGNVRRLRDAYGSS